MHFITDSRFTFSDGKKVFTVEYCYSLAKWFVFNDNERADAVYVSEIKRLKLPGINADAAEDVLIKYFNTLEQ